MKVLMLGWEFPPWITGGLGTACGGLTRALDQLGTEVLFVLPQPVAWQDEGSARFPGAVGSGGPKTDPFDHVRFVTVECALDPCQRPGAYRRPGAYQRPYPAGRGEVEPIEESFRRAGELGKSGLTTFFSAVGLQEPHYRGDLFAEVDRYTEQVVSLAADESFDVIHAHDWMTFPAGIALAKATGKPLVMHVHSTEFDRSPGQIDPRIYNIERAGLCAADRIIAVSHLTRSVLLSHYGGDPRRIHVVYNAVDCNGRTPGLRPVHRHEKIVLFLGRLTTQKGPAYFLAAAKKVLTVMGNVRFIMAGCGDKVAETIQMARRLGIADKVLFTGFLRPDDVSRVFRVADVYVMPSVSEPFGIAPLEALAHHVPAIISKQSGVSEVLQNVLKVDFWDVKEIANKIVAVLRYPPLGATLTEHAGFEVRRMSWQDAARRCLYVYHEAIHHPGPPL